MTRLIEGIPRDTHGQPMASGITGLPEDSSDYRYQHVTMGVLIGDFRFGTVTGDTLMHRRRIPSC